MTEAEWLACQNPFDLIHGPVRSSSDRKLRLLLCAFCRSAWEVAAHYNLRRAVEAAEGFADGCVTEEELGKLYVGFQADAKVTELLMIERQDVAAFPPLPPTWAAAEVCRRTFGGASLVAIEFGVRMTLNLWPNASAENPLTDRARCIFSNPFRPVTFSPAWRTETAIALAAQMYDSRDFSPIPILADALQDAGCDSDDVLSHCRGPGPHVRGCWVVDLVLGKE